MTLACLGTKVVYALDATMSRSVKNNEGAGGTLSQRRISLRAYLRPPVQARPEPSVRPESFDRRLRPQQRGKEDLGSLHPGGTVRGDISPEHGHASEHTSTPLQSSIKQPRRAASVKQPAFHTDSVS